MLRFWPFKKKPHWYYFSYAFFKENGEAGFGSITMNLLLPLSHTKDLEIVEDRIEELNGYQKTVILQFQKVKGFDRNDKDEATFKEHKTATERDE